MIESWRQGQADFAHDLGPHVQGRIGVLPSFKRQFRPHGRSYGLDVHIRPPDEKHDPKKKYTFYCTSSHDEGSGFQVLCISAAILLICQRFRQDSELPQNQCTYQCRRASKVEAHFTGWQGEKPRDRGPPDNAGAGKNTERVGWESCALIWIGSAPCELSFSKRLWRQRCSSRKKRSKFRINCLSGCPRRGFERMRFSTLFVPTPCMSGLFQKDIESFFILGTWKHSIGIFCATGFWASRRSMPISTGYSPSGLIR